MKTWRLEPGLGPEARTAFASLHTVFALEGELVARSPISKVLRVQLDGQTYYVKRYLGDRRGPRSWYGLRTLFAPIRVQREWENLDHFSAWGIPAARIVARGLEKNWGVFHRGALVTEEVPGARSLADLARKRDALLSNPDWVAAVLEQTASATKTLHAHRFVHNDLKWRNLLVDDASPPRLTLIDCPVGGFWWGPFLRYRKIKDLACLDKLGKYHLSRTQRLRFYLAYAGRRRLVPADKKVLRHVLRFFQGRE